MKILIVDDNEDIVETISVYLSAKYEVASFSNALEALTYYNEHDDINVVISDYYMPELYGDKLIEKIFKFNPTQQFILITSGPSTTDIRTLQEKYEKLVHVIWKPYSLFDIDKLINSF